MGPLDANAALTRPATVNEPQGQLQTRVEGAVIPVFVTNWPGSDISVGAGASDVTKSLINQMLGGDKAASLKETKPLPTGGALGGIAAAAAVIATGSTPPRVDPVTGLPIGSEIPGQPQKPAAGAPKLDPDTGLPVPIDKNTEILNKSLS